MSVLPSVFPSRPEYLETPKLLALLACRYCIDKCRPYFSFHLFWVVPEQLKWLFSLFEVSMFHFKLGEKGLLVSGVFPSLFRSFSLC